MKDHFIPITESYLIKYSLLDLYYTLLDMINYELFQIVYTYLDECPFQIEL